MERVRYFVVLKHDREWKLLQYLCFERTVVGHSQWRPLCSLYMVHEVRGYQCLALHDCLLLYPNTTLDSELELDNNHEYSGP